LSQKHKDSFFLPCVSSGFFFLRPSVCMFWDHTLHFLLSQHGLFPGRPFFPPHEGSFFFGVIYSRFSSPKTTSSSFNSMIQARGPCRAWAGKFWLDARVPNDVATSPFLVFFLGPGPFSPSLPHPCWAQMVFFEEPCSIVSFFQGIFFIGSALSVMCVSFF